MIIKEVNITNFGKIKNKRYTFSDGINVIYGENEAGKSTIQQFIKGMLFGLEKKRGRSVEGDEYTKYEPWDAPSYFSGSLIFETGGQQFLLERNFYHKEPTVRLINMGDLEELSVEKGDLAMLLGNVTKAAYENTYCIGQERMLPQADLGIMLSDERTNLTQTKDASFQLSAALEKLSQKKKQCEKQIKELENQRQVQMGQLRSKQQLLEDQIGQLGQKVELQMGRERQLEQQMRANKAKEAALEAEAAKPQEVEQIVRSQDRKKQWNPLVIIGVAGALLLQILISWAHVPSMPCRVGQIVFAVLIIAGFAITMRKNEAAEQAKEQAKMDSRNEHSVKLRELQDAQRECYMEYRAAQTARETIAQEMQEQEVLLENNRAQQEELEQPGMEERELMHEIDAVCLAMNTMRQIASSYAEETDDFINSRMSQIISAITDGKYDDLRLEDSKQLYLTENYHKRKPESYSQATMQQMYFAYRMAAGEMLAKEELLPLMFDEAFASYDEVRLKEVLDWLASQKRQVLIFTCRRLEREIMQEMGKTFTDILL